LTVSAIGVSYLFGFQEPRNMAGSRATDAAARILVREIEPGDWVVIEALFGDKGACGGCWCMYWRVPIGGKTWQGRSNDRNRKDFKKLVTSGRVFGCLAFCGNEPVGWCCIGPRADFPRLARVKALATEWTDRTWSITCFYIPSKWRGRGVATRLVEHAVIVARKHGATELEGYPVAPAKGGESKIPAAFAWTGVTPLFERRQFVKITLPGQSRSVYQRRFQ
jgi:predicted GNAT family acetyltransferase